MAHLYTYPCMDIIISIKRKWSKIFSVDIIILFSNVSYFLPILLLKLFHFLQVGIFLKLISLNFQSCWLPQVNLIQNCISLSISKRHVQKQKLSLIIFHLFWMMIIFLGFTREPRNDYAVLNYSKESMLLRLLLMYWERRVFIIKVVTLLRKNFT